ncbi:MAG: hypothetical protein JJT94_11155 [Bernardetiaceae bacterium]|nr:hypothetical protein [Bernardetiaceae bacterium]
MRMISTAILSLLIFLVYLYVGMPTINYGFWGLPFGLFLALLPLSAAAKANQAKGLFNVLNGTMVVLVIYMFILPIFTTWSAFHASKYRDLIGEVQTGNNFSEDVAPVSVERIRIVDQAVAMRLGDKVIGSKPALGSQTVIGDFNIQRVGNDLYWVAPLLHSGLMKWLNNREGTPGYVMVSATNERDVRLVQEVDGKPVRIKYQPGAYGFDDLTRHIYLNGYMTTGFTDYTLEIDDDGHPFWVITLYDKTIGFAGEDAKGVLTVNTETGEIKEYSINDAPQWLDRIQPEWFVTTQLNDWGEFVHGFINLSNLEKLTTTPGTSLVYGEDDRAYWYTGLSSVGSDEGTVGFVLVDTRTKETKWYKQVGATEQAAQASASGKVQEKGYYSSHPVTYNINGVPTYVVPLKDRAGLIKMIAMVSVQDYSIVGVGNNLQESLRAYRNSLNSSGNAVSPSSGSKRYEIKGIVARVSPDVNNGNTNYYIIIEGDNSKIYVGSSSISAEFPLTQAGDSVMIICDDKRADLIDAIGFDNYQIGLEASVADENIDIDELLKETEVIEIKKED